MAPGRNTRSCVARRLCAAEHEGPVTRERDSNPPDSMDDMVLDDNEEGGNIIVDLTTDEFFEPIPMEGIPQLVKQHMCVVAPVLQGLGGVYDEHFFATVVGLCSTGILVEEVPHLTAVTDKEIQEKWKHPRGDKYKFPVSLSVDKAQAAQFVQHYHLVYGGQPCNDSFSIRFLRACFATFVHNVHLNWVIEAVKTRNARMEQPTLNWHRLGPVAMRQQLASLCEVVASHYGHSSRTTNQSPTTPPVANKEAGSMRHGSGKRHSSGKDRSEAVVRAKSELREFLKQAKEARTSSEQLWKSLTEIGVTLVAIERDERALDAQWTVLVDKATAMQRQGKHDSAMQKLKEGSEVVDELLRTRELLDTIWAIRIEALPNSMKTVVHSKACVVNAVEKFRKVKASSFAMRPRAPFVYPASYSEPPLSITGPKFRAGCMKKGFLARAVIIASCGCGFHPICIASLLEGDKHTCPYCETAFCGAWMAQFGVPLTPQMEHDVFRMRKRLKAEPKLKTIMEPDLREA